MVSIIILSIVLIILIGVLIYFVINKKNLKVRLLEEEAEKGTPETQLALGLMFYSGVQVAENKEKGKYYILKAAENGNAQAQYLYSGIILGNDNTQGKEPTKEQLLEAASWIEKSADGGFLKAIVTLATMYAEGKIFPKNVKKSQHYFTEAAKKGDTQSQITVAGIHHFSMGSDKTLAYAWYKLAEENGSEYAKETAEKLLTELTEEEKEKAFSKAEEFMVQYGKNAVH